MVVGGVAVGARWLAVEVCSFGQVLVLFFFLMRRRPPISTLFPYPTLFRSDARRAAASRRRRRRPGAADRARARRASDRKSTRLNSSHVAISYAVFCLKK